MLSSTLALGLSLALPLAAPLTGGIDWYEDGYNKAVRDAKKQDKLIFLAFVPEWSNYSQKLLAETFPDERVAGELSDLICLKFTDDSDRTFAQVGKIFNVESYPTFVIANSNGRIEDRIEGFIPPEPMVEQMTRIKAGEGTVGWHRAKLEEEQDNLEHTFSLATMLENVRDFRGAEKAYKSIRTADPKGHTTAGCRLVMQDLWAEVQEAGGDDKSSWNVEPIYAYAEQLETRPTRFQAYGDLGNFEASVGQMARAFDAFMSAWETMPEDNDSRGWARDIANFILEHGEDEANDTHREFALTLASHAVEQAQKVRDEYVAENGTSKSEDGGDYDAWVASHIDVLVWAQYTFGEGSETRQLAVANCKRCIELDPENPEYEGRLSMLEQGM